MKIGNYTAISAIIVLTIVALSLIAATELDCRDRYSKGDIRHLDENRMLELVNKERLKRGLDTLAWNGELTRVARGHATDMFKNDFFDHKSATDGSEPAHRIARSAIYASKTAENIALDRNVDNAHQGLMNSPGHRKNILDPEFTHIGIGIIDGGLKGIYVCQNFAKLIPVSSPGEIQLTLYSRLRNHVLPMPLHLNRRLNDLAARHTETMIEQDRVFSPNLKEMIGGFSEMSVFVATTDQPDQPNDSMLTDLSRYREVGIGVRLAKTRNNPNGIYFLTVLLANK